MYFYEVFLKYEKKIQNLKKREILKGLEYMLYNISISYFNLYFELN